MIESPPPPIGLEHAVRVWLQRKRHLALSQVNDRVRRGLQGGDENSRLKAMRLVQATAKVLGEDYGDWRTDFGKVLQKLEIDESALSECDPSLVREVIELAGLSDAPVAEAPSLGKMVFVSTLVSPTPRWAENTGRSGKFSSNDLQVSRANDPIFAK